MTIASILPTARTVFLDTNSNPLSGGQVFFYVPPNTTTLKTTWQDATGTIPNDNPVILDGNGSALIYGTGQYLMEVWDSDNNLIYTGLTQDLYGLVVNSANIFTGANDFTGGSITVPTEPFGDDSTNAASTAFVQDAIAGIASPTPIYGGAVIKGLVPSSINGSSTTAALQVSIGSCTDSTSATIMSSTTILNWAVSNGTLINGFQGGTTLPNSSTIHFFLCNGNTGYGLYASTTLSPSIPTGYSTYSRRIFSLITDGSGNLLRGSAVEVEGGALAFYLATQTDQTVSLNNIARTLFTIVVPSQLNFEPFYRADTNATGGHYVLLTSPFQTDAAPTPGDGSPPSFIGAPGFDVGLATLSQSASSPARSGILITNTSAQLGARSTNASLSLYYVNQGWKDFRRD